MVGNLTPLGKPRLEVLDDMMNILHEQVNQFLRFANVNFCELYQSHFVSEFPWELGMFQKHTDMSLLFFVSHKSFFMCKNEIELDDKNIFWVFSQVFLLFAGGFELDDGADFKAFASAAASSLNLRLGLILTLLVSSGTGRFLGCSTAGASAATFPLPRPRPCLGCARGCAFLGLGFSELELLELSLLLLSAAPDIAESGDPVSFSVFSVLLALSVWKSMTSLGMSTRSSSATLPVSSCTAVSASSRALSTCCFEGSPEASSAETTNWRKQLSLREWKTHTREI